MTGQPLPQHQISDLADEAEPTAEISPTVAVFAPVLMLRVELHATDNGTDIHLHPGGQGYWIARMVDALGATPILCSPTGGEPGLCLHNLIAEDGLSAARLVAGEQWNPIVIEDRRGRTPVVMAESGIPVLGRHELDDLYSATVGAAIGAGTCVIAGAQLSTTVNDDIFRRLVGDLRANGVTVIVDIWGSSLRAALKTGVDVVKLSHEELKQDGWSSGHSVQAIKLGMGRLRRAGADAVVISRSDLFTMASFDRRSVEVHGPTLEVLDGRGGGDSMSAALAVAAATNRDFTDALRLAAAAGALNVSRHGLGTGRRDSIEDLAGLVDIRDIRPGTGKHSSSSAGGLDDATRRELYSLAKERNLAGRSSMTRAELLAALTQSIGD